MKKNYFMLALASMMMAACANNDLVDEGVVKEEVPQAIEFETFANKTTRAEMNETSIKGEGFNVWGYKTANNTSFTVFDGVEVTWKEATDDVTAHWGYENTQYWDETATYKFYAVAPYSNDLKQGDDDEEYKYAIDANGMITIKNAESKISTESDDYVIDRAGKLGVDGSAKEVVEFNFNHIMAKLSFVLEAGVSEDITVTELKMSGWNNAKGTFSQTLDATPNDCSHSEWSFGGSTVPGVITLVSEGESLINETVIDSYIMVPQTIVYTAAQPAVVDNPETTDVDESANAVPESGLTFTISYTIGEEVFTDQVGVVPSDQIWGTDTHTTYTITVGPAEIKFNVNSVSGWQTGNGSVTIQ